MPRPSLTETILASLTLTSPLGIVAVAASETTPRPTLAAVLVAACAGALACIAIAGARSGLQGHGLAAIFWVREPRAVAISTTSLSVPECKERLDLRLAELGFERRAAGSPDTWVVFKGRSAKGRAFVARPFLGFVHAEARGSETLVRVELRLMETLAIETGERARLQRLANRLSLRETDPGRAPWPLAARIGATLAATAAIQSLAVGATPPWLDRWIFNVSLAALVFLVPSVVGPRDRDEGGLGWRLTGLWLALVPFAGWLVAGHQ